MKDFHTTKVSTPLNKVYQLSLKCKVLYNLFFLTLQEWPNDQKPKLYIIPRMSKDSKDEIKPQKAVKIFSEQFTVVNGNT